MWCGCCKWNLILISFYLKTRGVIIAATDHYNKCANITCRPCRKRRQEISMSVASHKEMSFCNEKQKKGIHMLHVQCDATLYDQKYVHTWQSQPDVLFEHPFPKSLALIWSWSPPLCCYIIPSLYFYLFFTYHY